MREIQKRVKGRPLLLEQVAQVPFKKCLHYNVIFTHEKVPFRTKKKISTTNVHGVDNAKLSLSQMNAKRAAEKLYSATLHGCGLSESFISSKAPKGLKHRQTPSPTHSGSQTPPTYRYKRQQASVLIHFRNVYKETAENTANFAHLKAYFSQSL